MTDTPNFPASSVLGYPRIGPRRELKKALEAFWAGRTTADEVEATAADLRRRTRTRLAELGLATDVPGDPERVLVLRPRARRDRRGRCRAGPLRGRRRRRRRARPRRLLDRGPRPRRRPAARDDQVVRHQLPLPGPRDRPGDRRSATRATARCASSRRPSRTASSRVRSSSAPSRTSRWPRPPRTRPRTSRPIDRLADLLPVYAELLQDLAAAGATWVQLEEPALVSDSIAVPAEQLLAAVIEAYRALATDLTRPPGHPRRRALRRPRRGVPGARRHGRRGHRHRPGPRPRARPRRSPGLETKTLVAGVIDGHNIWRADLDAKLAILEQLEGLGAAAVTVGTSTSLFHVPHTHDGRAEPRRDAEELARVRRREGRRGRHAGRGPDRGPRGHPRAAARRHRRGELAPHGARRRRPRGPRPRRPPSPRTRSTAARSTSARSPRPPGSTCRRCRRRPSARSRRPPRSARRAPRSARAS